MLAAVPSFDSQLELVSTNRPREMAPVAWDSEVDHALRQALALFSLACSYLPVPVIAPGLLGSAAAQHAVCILLSVVVLCVVRRVAPLLLC